MMQVIQFEVPLLPTAQMRAKPAIIGKHATVYKCAKQKANEQSLESYLIPHRPEQPISCPVQIKINAYFPVPKSLSKKKRVVLESYKTPYFKKPDVDNLAKQMLDALTRMQYWVDDAKVFSISCKKWYCTNNMLPHWDVQIVAWDEPENGILV